MADRRRIGGGSELYSVFTHNIVATVAVSFDALVGQTDLDTVLGDWGQGVPPPAVPEPATLGMFAICGAALLRRKPKSR